MYEVINLKGEVIAMFYDKENAQEYSIYYGHIHGIYTYVQEVEETN